MLNELSFSVILVLSAFAVLTGCTQEKFIAGNISEVEDGDTLKLDGGERVRLIGVDCPEPNLSLDDSIHSAQAGVDVPKFESHKQKSKEFVEKFIKRGNIRIKTDPQHKAVEYRDHINRLLVYVYAGDELLNEALVREGICMREKEVRYTYMDSFRDLEQKARDAKIGIWSE